MKCRRYGCPNQFKKGGGYFAEIFDERRLIKEKEVAQRGGVRFKVPHNKYIADYQGEKVMVCDSCYRIYELFKYVLIYYVEGTKIKFRRKSKTMEEKLKAPAEFLKKVDAPIEEEKPKEEKSDASPALKQKAKRQRTKKVA